MQEESVVYGLAKEQPLQNHHYPIIQSVFYTDAFPPVKVFVDYLYCQREEARFCVGLTGNTFHSSNSFLRLP